MVNRDCKSKLLQVLFFPFFILLIFLRFGLLAENTWSVCLSKSHWNSWVSFSRTVAGLYLYLFVLSNLNLLHIFQWITLFTQSCIITNNDYHYFTQRKFSSPVITGVSWAASFHHGINWYHCHPNLSQFFCLLTCSIDCSILFSPVARPKYLSIFFLLFLLLRSTPEWKFH